MKWEQKEVFPWEEGEEERSTYGKKTSEMNGTILKTAGYIFTVDLLPNVCQSTH